MLFSFGWMCLTLKFQELVIFSNLADRQKKFILAMYNGKHLNHVIKASYMFPWREEDAASDEESNLKKIHYFYIMGSIIWFLIFIYNLWVFPN